MEVFLIPMSDAESEESREMNVGAKAAAEGLTTTVHGLLEHAGTHLGTTEWQTLTQEQVDVFAVLTDDHNFIHVDPERAARTPFGGTIVHGYLTLAMLAPASFSLLRVEGASLSVNYGLDRLRFPGPLPVGARFRTSMELVSAEEVKGNGVEARVTATIEVEGLRPPRRGRRLPVPVLRVSGATSLDGKVAVVTGSGRGLGRAYAIALAAAGASVVVNDVDADAAAETAAAIASAGGSAATVIAPVGSTETADALVGAAVSEFGRLDVMCTNAGVLRDRVLWKMSDEDFDPRHRDPPARHVHLRARGGDPDARAGGGRAPDPRRLAGRPARQLRPDELLGGQGGHRLPGADVGARAGPRGDHGQRDRPRPPGPR